MGELPYERHQRHVGQGRVVGQQIIATVQQLLQPTQKHLTLCAIKRHRLLRIALGILVAVQMHLEDLIVLLDQRRDGELPLRIILEQPILRIIL
ncbi:hypothetical protein D3C76_1488790 [compost metagenome]